MRRRLSLAAVALVACALAGCGSDESGKGGAESTTTASAVAQWGSYPADTSLDEREVVEAYVQALDRRDGARFCSVVAPWISGRFDLGGTDPDAPLSRPLRCPEFVPAFIGYIEDCCPPKFLGATVAHVGELDRRGAVVGVPITVTLRLEDSDVGGAGAFAPTVVLESRVGKTPNGAPSRCRATSAWTAAG